VATPGRLLDLIENFGLDIKYAKYLILDEGDAMIDIGFEKDLDRLMSRHLSNDVRSMVFSATVPKFIQETAMKKMENPILIDLVGTDTH
jgi:ATP-dependent RNA helicase RhlE